MNDTTQPYKAVIAFVLTFLAALAASLQGRQDRLGNMNASEWLFVVVGALVVAGGTYLTPNPAKTVRRRGELGQGILYIALVVVVVLVAIWLLTLLVR